VAATRTIQLRTEIPGPRSRAICERSAEAVARALALTFPVVVESAQGAALTDVDGNTFIDFAGGIGSLNVGHSHPRVLEAAHEQLDRFSHTDFTLIPYEPYVALAERLGALVPISGPVKAAFFNSGAEAVENAVKFARLATKRPAVIAFEGAFHGRTLMALSLTSKVAPYKLGLGPFAPEVYRVPFPHPYRGVTTEQALSALERALRTHVAPEAVAAMIVEPVQGEGGFIVAPPEFLAGLREVCDRHGIVLIADEVQSGFGRTGRFFGIEHAGVEPDLVCVAKSIANGLPLSGVIGRAEVMDAAPPGSVGGTFVGNPVAQAAALAVLDVIEDESLLDRSLAIGDAIRARMLGWQGQWPEIGEVRGLGAMLAIELVSDPATREPDKALAQRVVDEALRRGLLLLTCGLYGNGIRVLVPLVISDAELDEALDVWEDALAAAISVG
jgi:4-aminobutyrate aminotransferase/(S)-3-amino-2-methylpropionate transaminase